VTGHLMGASGAIETVICALTIWRQEICPTINLEQPDPACDLDYVRKEARGVSGAGGGESERWFWRAVRLSGVEKRFEIIVELVDVIKITALMAALLNVGLTLLVLGRDFRSRLHRVYVLWGISVTLWNLAVFQLSRHDPNLGPVLDPAQALVWAKILQLGVIFLPVTMFHLCTIILGVRLKWWMPVLYLLHTAFALTLYPGWFITNVRWIEHTGYWGVAGWAFKWFGLLYTAMTSALMIMVYEGQKSAPPTHRTRLRRCWWPSWDCGYLARMICCRSSGSITIL